MQGAGIATAKALIEATTDAGGLSFKRRGDVRMYYRVRPRLVLWPQVRCCAAVPSPLSCCGFESAVVLWSQVHCSAPPQLLHTVLGRHPASRFSP